MASEMQPVRGYHGERREDNTLPKCMKRWIRAYVCGFTNVGATAAIEIPR